MPKPGQNDRHRPGGQSASRSNAIEERTKAPKGSSRATCRNEVLVCCLLLVLHRSTASTFHSGRHSPATTCFMSAECCCCYVAGGRTQPNWQAALNSIVVITSKPAVAVGVQNCGDRFVSYFSHARLHVYRTSNFHGLRRHEQRG